MRASDLLATTPAGLYCAFGDFYIDPTRAVPRALITHAHSDHARAGHGKVLATAETLGIMALRYGANHAGATQAIPYGEPIDLGGIRVSFHPAGHVLGSAQIRLECEGFVLVVSGDYKRERDPTCLPFEPLACHVFITEATFGLPVFHHSQTAGQIDKLLASLHLFPERPHLIGAYTLGKAQRLMALLREAGYTAPILLHGSMEKLTRFYEEQGIDLGETRKLDTGKRGESKGKVILCPPSALGDAWARKFDDPVLAFASGWMRIRAFARQRGVELPLVISDHADWEGLCATILETRCEEVLVTHGEAEALVHWASNRGLKAEPLHLLGYGDEEAEPEETSEAPA
ncbi:ligase-associated DNA damage response exonuclease [Beijerinckia indica]|uniref:Putative mRNA 3-end processing factor n=1 Tax=Beijerinckia indica subsp. indica (strain ATCC 9039 / DSM 1715 / NCIMB 8712) TaxID=395963 RepID=B2IIM2_BEII9|nr:ligase-associated DNA damage response exonuclease [Beijerinckia indica]ACB94715.1 putative mRNA 3-end processing factor [Beijerinckia indica subsp. indica ATCC 9039]